MEQKDTKLLRYALSWELEWQEFYRSKMSELSNEVVKAVFRQLCEFEKEHVEILSCFIGSKNINVLNLDLRELTESFPSEFGYLAQNAFKTDLMLLSAAYMMEHSHSNFYEKIVEDVSNQELRPVLLQLADSEKQHRDILKTVYDELLMQFWSEQGFYPLI